MLQSQVPAMRRMVNTPPMQSTASIVSLVTQRQMPNIEKIPKTVEIFHVVQGQCPSSWRSRRSLSHHRYCSWMRLLDERQVRATQTRRTPGSCHRSRTSSKSLVFPWRGNTRFLQFQCDEQQMLVIQMCSKTNRGAPTTEGGVTSQLSVGIQQTDHRRSDAPMNTRSRSGR